MAVRMVTPGAAGDVMITGQGECGDHLTTTTSKGRRIMPFSKDNPRRNANFAIAVAAFIVIFAIVMAGYIYLDARARDTANYERFLTLLVTTIGFGVVNLWKLLSTGRKVDHAAEKAGTAAEKADQVAQQTNGVLDRRIEEAVERALSATGQTPLPGLSANERRVGLSEEAEQVLPQREPGAAL